MTFTEIQSKIKNASDLDFGTILSECIALFKKCWLQGFLTIIIIALITVPITFISQVVVEGFGLIAPQSSRFQDFNLESLSALYGLSSLYNFPFAIITTFFQLSILAAFFRILKIKDIQNTGSEDYFYFFKKEYFGKTLLLAVIYAAIALVCQFMCFIPMIYAVVPLMFISVVYAFNSEKSVEDILKLSFGIGNKKWLLTFGCLFICGLMAMLGLIACFIGILFTLSIVYLPGYIIYKHVVGFEEVHEMDQIGIIQDF